MGQACNIAIRPKNRNIAGLTRFPRPGQQSYRSRLIEGSEIYLKPVSRYVRTDVPMDFYTITASAADLNESATDY